jgi:transcriptional regulator with XRE-family HTH domain
MAKTLPVDRNKIKALRLQRNWPQEQLARIADLSPRTIQRVEAGGNASFETLRAIASAFELEAHQLQVEGRTTAVDEHQAAGDDRFAGNLDEAPPVACLNPNHPLKLLAAALGGSLLTGIIFSFYLAPRLMPPQMTQRPGVVSGTSVQKSLPLSSVPTSNERVGAPQRPEGTRVKSAVMVRKTRSGQNRPEKLEAILDARPWPVLETVSFNTTPFFISSTSANPKHQVTASEADGKPERGAVAVNEAANSPEPEVSPSQTGRGLTAHTKEAATVAYRSASETFRQSGKRSAGYFSKLAASIKKVY